MILSTNVVDKENEGNDSSSDSSIKDEGLEELKNIMNKNKKSIYINYLIFFLDEKKEDKNKNVFTNANENCLGPEDSVNNLSKIELKNQSINTSLKSFSRGEEILQALNGQPSVSIDIYFIYIFKIFRKKMETKIMIVR